MAKGKMTSAGQPQTTYTLAEVMAASVRAFGVPPEVVAGAARAAGRSEMTRDEWQQAIQNYLKREV